jgi:glutathione S-transferase
MARSSSTVLYGALGSPYSLKVRAALRYRRIPHRWVDAMGGQSGHPAIAHVRPPVIPVLQMTTGDFMVDSTPMLVELDRTFPSRTIIPPDPAAALFASIIEDFADEWLTKVMFWARWHAPIDQMRSSKWLAATTIGVSPGTLRSSAGGAPGRETANAAEIEQLSGMLAKRQLSRMTLVGCEDSSLMQASYERVCQILERHLEQGHRFFFGARPSIAELGLYGQLSQLAEDSTPREFMREHFPLTFAWISSMADLSGLPDGQWDADAAAVRPVVGEMLGLIGELYVPFLLANEAALRDGDSQLEVKLLGGAHLHTQPPFGYQAKCLAALRQQVRGLQDAPRDRAQAVLTAAGCWEGALADDSCMRDVRGGV